MKMFNVLAAAAATVLMGSTALAQIPQEPPVANGDLRAPSPVIMDADRPGYFQLGVGPSFGVGIGTERVMYDINGGYNYNLSDRLTGKIFGDFNLGSGAETARWITLGVGADAYLQEVQTGYGIPYVTADVGYGFTRSSNTKTTDAPAIGAGAGFKFAAESLNVDVNLHYQVLTAQLDDRTPSIVALRAALAF